MKITTRIAHGTDAIHCHAAILRPKNNRLQVRRICLYAIQLPPLRERFVVQVKLAGFKSKFLRLLVARMTHNHVEQYPACLIFADHTVSFARERPLTVIAKYFPAHLM
jgi:hypothetical protein